MRRGKSLPAALLHNQSNAPAPAFNNATAIKYISNGGIRRAGIKTVVRKILPFRAVGEGSRILKNDAILIDSYSGSHVPSIP